MDDDLIKGARKELLRGQMEYGQAKDKIFILRNELNLCECEEKALCTRCQQIYAYLQKTKKRVTELHMNLTRYPKN